MGEAGGAGFSRSALTHCPAGQAHGTRNSHQRLWLYLRKRFLSHRLLDDTDTIVDACCAAWNRLTPERLRLLCSYPYIQQANR